MPFDKLSRKSLGLRRTLPFDHFDFIAPLYHRVGTYSNLDAMISYADLPTAGRLLDVGGGTGRVTNALRSQAKQIVLADPSRGMLHYSTSVPDPFDPLRAALQAAAAISERLPFPDESFDRVIMVDAFHHVFSQTQTAREMWRVLKPGGRIVIEEPDIHSFGVKLIAIAEKLLLMRSHFLSPQNIEELFSAAATQVHSEDGTAWIIIQK